MATAFAAVATNMYIHGLRDTLILVDTRDGLVIADTRDILRAIDARDNIAIIG